MAGGVERFMGGSVVGTIIKLVVISIALGLVLAWLNLTPWELIENVRRSLEHLFARGFRMVGDLFSYFLLGAVIVVPVWIVLRLLQAGRGGGK
ncbi:hypothetical protein LMIY3S_03757 [Labrys miyagiensis]